MSQPTHVTVYRQHRPRIPANIVGHVLLTPVSSGVTQETEWAVRTPEGTYLGEVRAWMYTPVRMSRPSDYRRGHRVDLAPRKVWNAYRAQGELGRTKLPTRNEALLTLLED